MTTRRNFRNRREQRQKDATTRQAAYDKLSQEQKRARLIEGGSSRQRERGSL